MQYAFLLLNKKGLPIKLLNTPWLVDTRFYFITYTYNNTHQEQNAGIATATEGLMWGKDGKEGGPIPRKLHNGKLIIIIIQATSKSSWKRNLKFDAII